MISIESDCFLLDLIDFVWILSKQPHHKCHPVDRWVRKPYKNNTFGCKVGQKAYKTNALENYQIKNDFSSKHFLLVLVEPDAVLLMKLIILSVGAKSFAHRTLLYLSSKMITHKWYLYLSKTVCA